MVSRAGLRIFREQGRDKNIHFFKNMVPEDFLRLIYNSRGIVGNSSVAIRESSFMGIPAVNIGNRQAGRERGKNVIDVPYEKQAIQDAILRILDNGHFEPDSHIYGGGEAGTQIAELLATAELSVKKQLGLLRWAKYSASSQRGVAPKASLTRTCANWQGVRCWHIRRILLRIQV